MKCWRPRSSACGVLRVDTISELFDMAEVLAKQPRPKGPRLTIITNAGGPGVLATDALITSGGALAEVSKGTIEELNKILPADVEPQQSRGHPRRRQRGSLREVGGNRGRKIRTATACWSFSRRRR